MMAPERVVEWRQEVMQVLGTLVDAFLAVRAWASAGQTAAGTLAGARAVWALEEEQLSAAGRTAARQ